MEGLIPRLYGSDAVEVPGARVLLDSLTTARKPWTIVTSGTRALLTGWLDVMKMPEPRNLVVAEDVSAGKPAPDCYHLGMERLALRNPSEILVVEDSTSGVLAGKAAGCKVLAVVTTHSIEQLARAGANWIVQDLRDVKLVEETHVGGSAATNIDVSISNILSVTSTC